MSRLVETPLGTFRKVAGPETAFLDRWTFACPGCGQEAYLDDDQWHGRVSVDHDSMGCPGGYHETHDYFSVLKDVLNGRVDGAIDGVATSDLLPAAARSGETP